MESKRPKRGPEMSWFRNMGKSELVTLFDTKFFGSCRARRSAFICGAYRASPTVAQEMIQWWSSFGVKVGLHQIRPDLYGENDTGPSRVKQSA